MSSFGTPYEKFNVFDKELQDELSNRRLSDNLVEIRAPFIRYTTAVEMPNKEWESILDECKEIAEYIRNNYPK